MTQVRPTITSSPKRTTEVRNSLHAPITTDTIYAAPAPPEQEGVVQDSPNIGEESFFTWNLPPRSVPRSITPQTKGRPNETSNDLTHLSRLVHQNQGTGCRSHRHHQEDHQQKHFWSQSHYDAATEMNAKYLISLMKETDLSRQAVEEIMPFALQHDSHQKKDKKARSGKKMLRRRGRSINITNKGGEQKKRRLSLTKLVPSVVYAVTKNSNNHSPLYKGVTSTQSEVSLLETMSVIQDTTQHHHQHKNTAAEVKRQKRAAERPPHDSNINPEDFFFHEEERVVESRSIYTKWADNHCSISEKSTKKNSPLAGCLVQHTNLIECDYCHYPHNEQSSQQSHKSLDTKDAFDVFFSMSSSNFSLI